jgi:hypothetical protein
MAIKLTLTNKWLYSLLILVAFLVLGVGVWAYQSTLPPSVFGHTGNEIDITINGETKLLSEFLTSGELGSSTTIVRHSQTATAPECNAGWTKLWEGYSLAGTFLAPNVGSGQDLGSTGSCLKKLYPIPFVECDNVKNCDYYTGGDYSMWLSARDSNTGPLSGMSNIEPIISKCSVCSK